MEAEDQAKVEKERVIWRQRERAIALGFENRRRQYEQRMNPMV